MKQAKKLLSFVLALTMVLALFSGVVLFNSSAEDDIVLMPLAGLDQYTAEELAKFTIVDGTAVNLSKDEAGHTVINGAVKTNQWNSAIYFSPTTSYDQWSKNPLVNKDKPLFDLDLSNKLGLYIKVISTGTNDFMANDGKVWFTYGSTTKAVAIDSKDGPCSRVGDYYFIDFSKAEVVGAGWYDDCKTWADSYYGIIDEAKIGFILPASIAAEKKNYTMRVEMYAVGYTDTVALGEMIVKAKDAVAAGTKVNAKVLADAEAIYKDVENKDQSKVDAAVKALKAELSPYDFVTLPGIQDWGEEEMSVYNAQAATKKSYVGTPGTLVNDHLVGDATQAIKLTMGGKPNDWTVAFSTLGNADDLAAASQIGDIFGGLKVKDLSQYLGLRIGVVNENGEKPSLATWDASSPQQIYMKLVGSDQKSWNNTWYPIGSINTTERPDYTAYYEDGYYYFFFKNLSGGWGENSEKFFADRANNTYGNLYFWLQNGGINNAAYNGGAIYISEMQLFKDKFVYDISDLNEDDYTAESWAALMAAIEARSESACDAARAALVHKIYGAVTANFFAGWTTENVNAVVTANADKLDDSINGEALAFADNWRNCDFTKNTEFTANNNFVMKATEDKATKTMGWKSMDRSGTLSAGGKNAGYPAMDLTGIKDSSAFHINVKATGSYTRGLVGFSNCAYGGNREMYYFFDAEDVPADGELIIPWSKFEKAWWCDAFTADKLDEMEVFICEIYGAANGTEVTFSNAYGYGEADTSAYDKLWQYNYTDQSWAAFKAAYDTYSLEAIAAAAANLVPAPTEAVTGNLFEGWTTVAVNAVVTANADKSGDSINGEALAYEGEWRNCDFTKYTEFTANNNFAMKATEDKATKTMGWKSMDRSGTLAAGGKNAAYPEMNLAGIGGDGLRVKIEVTGSVKNLLIGFSNCAFGGNREMYAFIDPANIGADGYINIPWSKFEKAWWCDGFTASDLGDAIVWICEAYGAANETTVTFSDMHAYVNLQTYTPDMFNLGFENLKPVNTSAKVNDAVAHNANVVFDQGLETIVVGKGDGATGWVSKEITDADYALMEKGFTAEAIFKTTETGYEGALISVCNKGGWAFEVENNNLTVYHRLLTDSYAKIPGVPVKPNTYYHAVYTYDGSNVKVYLNGALQSTTAVDGLKFNTKIYQIGIGGQPSSADYASCAFLGNIASAKVYSKAIGATQVKANYDAYLATLEAIEDDAYWQDNYTPASWNKYLEARAAGDADAADLLVPVELMNITGNLFEGWTTTNVNEVVTANSDKIGDSVLGEGLDTAKDVWKNCDFTNNTEFTADNNFSIKATASFEGKTMCWKNMDRSGTIAGAANHGYPALTLADITKSEGLHVKIDVSNGGSFDRILLGFSTCTSDSGLGGNREMYALNITKDIVDANGFVNIPWSYFTKCWWCDAFTQNELDKIQVFIVEVYNATAGTKVTFSDVYAYAADTTTHGLWEYNYTPDSWADYQEAVATKDVQQILAAEKELVKISTFKTTGDLFEGWTTEAVNAVVEANSGKVGASIEGEALGYENNWRSFDFTSNTEFSADDYFAIKATENKTGKTMGWKNMDRSGTLTTANGGYPALNLEGLDKSQGLHVKIDVSKGGKFGRILLGFSNCMADNGIGGNKEMYALNITQEIVDTNGELYIPWNYFGKAWWCDAFTVEQLNKAYVFIVEVFDATEGTQITFSDMYGYDAAFETADLWEYNYTPESWAAYKDALKTQNSVKIDEAVQNLEVIDTIALTGNFFEGWTTDAINAVVTANSDKLGDSVVGEGYDTAKDVWKNCDFTNNTEFSGDNSFAMKATASFEGKTMCYKNMDRSGTLAPKSGAGYPALNIDGIKGSDGIRVQLAIDGSVTRILLGFSNCAADNGIGNKEMYVVDITADSVATDGYVTIPWSCFNKCWWTDAFTADQLDKIEVFIIEAFNATANTTVAINDMYAYKQVRDVTAEEIAKLYKAADALESFDVDGRYADLVKEARALDETSKNYYVDNAYDAIFAVLNQFKAIEYAYQDVPGYSIYTQEELDTFTGRDATWKVTKTTNGVKFQRTSGGGWSVANGAYGGDGYDDLDTSYGAVVAPNGKTFIDMLGGYSLSDIYSFRFKIDGGKAYIQMQYKDGKGLWDGMVTPAQTVYIANGYYEFKTNGIPTGAFDGWYGGKWTRDELKAMTKFILINPTENLNKEIYGWQVCLYNPIDRTGLKQLLLAPGAKDCDSYEDALATYYDAKADEYDVDDAVQLLAFEVASAEAAKLWEFNYTADSWAAFTAALNTAETAEEVGEAVSKLVEVETRKVTGNLFDGWTTKAINDVVTANSDKLGDSVLGEGLDTAQDVWKNCDFTNNTEFSGDNSFAMKATASFEGKTMCWKNMDRSGTLAGTANHGYPALNLDGILDSDGIRVKLTVDGEVTRILLGFSNCAADSGMKGNREMYALNITADSVASDGYVTIPWSCFGKCWWCDAFAANELDKMEVFIIEAYNATNGTTVSIDDIYGYQAIAPATQEELDNLAAAIKTVEDFDIDGAYASDIATASALLKGAYDYQVADALDQFNGIINDLGLNTIDRDALKANLLALANAALTDDETAVYENAMTAYYATATNQKAIDDAAFALQRILNKPATPEIEFAEITATTITVEAIIGGEYRIDGGEWTTNNVFEVALANTAYTIEARIAETDDAVASEIASKGVTTELGSFADATVVVSGTERYLETLTAEVSDVPAAIGEYTITWYRSPDIEIGTGATYEVTADDIGYALFVVVTSENAYDEVYGDDTGVIGKATVKDFTLPTASEIQYPQTLADSDLTGGTAEIEGTWQWAAPETQPLSSQSGNAFDVVFVPSEEYADLYDALQAKVAVVINRAPYEPTTFTDDQCGLVIEGEFMADAAVELEDITYDQASYLALLRASSKDNSGLKKLVLFKTVSFTVGGEEVAEPYNTDVDLTVKSFVGESRANETFSVWFFVDGQVVNYVGEVDANGVLTVSGVQF